MAEIPLSALILVAILPKPRDLEIARLLGWYRIPLRSAPKLLNVDYLAFYQPGSFGHHGGQVAYLAPVVGHELTTRGELVNDEPDHPRARQEYFKINLGGLIRLERPILSDKWKRFAFFYTTGEYFETAQTLSDLIVRSEDRGEIWHTLRERAASHGEYTTEAWTQVPDEVLLELFLKIQ